MTNYKVIILYEVWGKSRIWYSKTFTSRKKCFESFNEMQENSLSDLKKFDCSRTYKKTFRTISNINEDEIEINSIGTYFKRGNEWLHLKQSDFCKSCYRQLTDQESIRRGYGPDCWEKKKEIDNDYNDLLF